MNGPAADRQALRRQQQAFEAALLDDPTGGDGGLKPGPGGSPARLDVYRQAHAARLVGALRDNHDVLARAMGDTAFDALGRAYLAAHPSTRPSIRWFGDRLADFMDQCLLADDGRVPHPAMADIARLDWALRAAFDAADGPVLEGAALAALPAEAWPGLRLQLHPSVAMVPVQWAVAPAWHALRTAADAGDDEPDLPAPEPLVHTLLVWRHRQHTRWRTMPDGEAALFAAAAAGEPLAEVGARAAELGHDPAQAPARVVGLLQQWLAEGLVSGIGPAGGDRSGAAAEG